MDDNYSNFIGADDGIPQDYYEDFNPENLTIINPLITMWNEDESGSMGAFRYTLPTCLKMYRDYFLKDKLGESALFACTRFGDDIDVGGFKLIKDMTFDYNPDSSRTKLYESIGVSLRRLMEYMDEVEDAGANGRGVFITFSDGENNVNSSERHLEQKYFEEAKSLIKECNKELGGKRDILTVYVEFGTDASGLGKQLGYEVVLSCDATEEDLEKLITLIAKSSASVSKTGKSATANDFDLGDFRA